MTWKEKAEIVAYTLIILIIFTLINSTMVNIIGVLMAVRMYFRLRAITGKKRK